MRTGLSRFCVLVLFAMLTACAQQPTDVVLEAVSAARDNDRDGFVACFTPRSRALIDLWWARVDEQRPELGELGAGDVEIHGIRAFPDQQGSVERAVVELSESGRAFVVVVHRIGDRWRIDLVDTQRIAQMQGRL